ncbi:hypothetical protein CVT26_007850 [Gymnopilus dilepis]|uniref:Uncharacterized protein n=1 Tax=Gymnopilus dilepis TaxID=231916 RepID=A0A409WEI5_9AGAR|nr:hypothetical protein CVT26_007850 [Gymnopilus dilepis]
MGTWLNGCDEKDGIFLLRYRMPCFVIHVVDGLLEGDRVFAYHPHYYSFTTETYAAGLVANVNPFDLAVNLDGGDKLIVPEVVDDFAIFPAKEVTTPMFADRIRSSPVVQGCDGGKYKDPRTKPPTTNPANPMGLPRQYPEDKGGIVPPPVEDLLPKGSWSSWMTTYENLLKDRESAALYKALALPSDEVFEPLSEDDSDLDDEDGKFMDDAEEPAETQVVLADTQIIVCSALPVPLTTQAAATNGIESDPFRYYTLYICLQCPS